MIRETGAPSQPSLLCQCLKEPGEPLALVLYKICLNLLGRWEEASDSRLCTNRDIEAGRLK